uniref:S-phase kinase-associated protein 2 n=1 Tax=Sphenodon punctatus TaxID=8508 RepID=A0A8D0G3Y0_SPHPU
ACVKACIVGRISMDYKSQESLQQARPLQEILTSGFNVGTSFTWAWDPSKTSELLSGMGVSLLKDKLGAENTPQELLVSLGPPQKRQRVKEKDKDFVIARRPRLFREAVPGISWDALPDELLLGIFSYLPLIDLLKTSQVCWRWHRLAFDDSLWQTLDLSGKSLLPGVIGQLLPVGVTAFHCPWSCIGNPLFKSNGLLRVQHMDLSGCAITVVDLQGILCRCHKLQNLSLEGLALSDNIVRNIAENSSLLRLNLSGCSGFSPEALEIMLSHCSRLEELNLSWCDFTADHVKVAVNHITPKVTQLNFSGYRQNLQISGEKFLTESDSVMLRPECFQYFQQLVYLQHLCLSRLICWSPLAVFGIVTDNSLQVLKETLPHINFNCSYFTTIARPTVENQEFWGIKCRLTLQNL